MAGFQPRAGAEQGLESCGGAGEGDHRESHRSSGGEPGGYSSGGAGEKTGNWRDFRDWV